MKHRGRKGKDMEVYGKEAKIMSVRGREER